MKRVRKDGYWWGWFYDDTWLANLDIIWPVTDAQITQFARDRFGIKNFKPKPFCGGNTLDFTHPNGSQVQVICLHKWRCDPSYEEIGTLAHEVVHAVDWMMQHRGCVNPRNEENGEPFAYAVGAYMRRCLKLLDTRRKL